MLFKQTLSFSFAIAFLSLSFTAQAKAPAENSQQKGLRIAKEGGAKDIGFGDTTANMIMTLKIVRVKPVVV